MTAKDERLERLAKRVMRAQNKGRKHSYFKPTPDDTQIRLLPYPFGEKEPFEEFFFHYNVGGVRSLVCPKYTFGDECPFCEVAEEFKMMGGDHNFTVFKNLSAKQRTYSAVVVRGKEKEGIKIWGYGSTIYNEMLKKHGSDDYGFLDDPKSGHDLVVSVIPKGSPGNDSSYDSPQIDFRIKETPMVENIEEAKALVHSIPNLKEACKSGDLFNYVAYDKLLELVEKLATPEDESSMLNREEAKSESSQPMATETPVETPIETSSGDKLIDRLDGMLG
jgi:hypothetical protein